MSPQLLTIRASFDGKEMFVVDRSPELPQITEDPALVDYLNMLALHGWKAVRARFEGREVILQVEQQTEVPYKTIASYMIPSLHQIPCPGSRSVIATQHKQLMTSLHEMGEKEGWEVLAGPKQFSIDGVWTISIWVKSYPTM